MDKYLIWWTNQSDCERISVLQLDKCPEDWPAYLEREFKSRYGRAGRGRLWVASEHTKEAPQEADFQDANPVCRMASDAGGVVILAADHNRVRGLPGFVTTFAMVLIRG